MYVSQFRIVSITLLTAGHFFSDFYCTFLPALIPVFMENLNLSLGASGMIVMFQSITSNLLQPLCGYYIDKYNFSYLLLIGIPLSAIFICLSVLMPNYPLLIATVLLSGLGVSLFHPLGSSLVHHVAKPPNRGLAMSVFIGGGNFGFALAPAIVSYWLVSFDHHSLLWLAVPGIILTIFFYLLRLHKIELVRRNTIQVNNVWYKSKDIVSLNIIMGLRSWAQVAIMTFLPLYLVQHGYKTNSAGELLTYFLTGGAIGGLLGGYIGDRIGHKSCIFGALSLSVPFVYSIFSGTITPSLSWLLLACTGACLQGTMPSSIILAQQMLPANKSLASGMMLGLASGLGGIGAAIIGVLADNIGLSNALRFTIIPLTLAIPLTYRLNTSESFNRIAGNQ